MARNEDDWQEVYSLPAFNPSFNSENGNFDASEIFKWTELLEKDGKLRSIDVMRLRNIIEAAYINGRLSVE